MSPTWSRLVIVLTSVWLCRGVGAGAAWTQETGGGELLLRPVDAPAAPDRTQSAPAESPDRMARIEAQLHDLAERNRRLQEQYDTLARNYDRFLEQASAVVPAGGAGKEGGEGGAGSGDVAGAPLGSGDLLDLLERPFATAEEEEG